MEDSRGRRHAEPPHSYRDDFQRDRDRVIHSRAFRRLENKTQVFTRRYSDHFRNRLTHTIEVAQIARTLADQLGLNLDLTETLALVHDIGHPPFGHAGEKALDAVMRTHGESFDHNLHALRIVETFEQRYASFPGINLTFEVREGIIKHSHDYSPQEFPQLAEYLLDQHPPLEAQLIDLADEIAYNTADLDDGYEAKLITLAQVRSGVPGFEESYRDVEKMFPRVREKLRFNEALKRLLNRYVTDLIEDTRRRLEEGKFASVDAVRRAPARLAGFSDAVDRDRRANKEFLYRHLYFSPDLQPEKDQAERTITELFQHWTRDPQSLPAAYQEQMRGESLPRVVCDYIAGMTDNFILAQHARFCARASAAKKSPPR